MKNILFHNWQWKAVSFILAVLVWLTIQRATSGELIAVFNVRVDPRPSAGWQVTKVEPQRVAVSIRGPRSGVMGATADHFLVSPHVKNKKAGRTTVDVKASDVSAPSRIRVVKVEPSQIKVTLALEEQ